MSEIKLEAGLCGRSLIKINATTRDISVMNSYYIEPQEAERLKSELTAALQEVDRYEDELKREAERFMEGS